jgi:hypothetical protein
MVSQATMERRGWGDPGDPDTAAGRKQWAAWSKENIRTIDRYHDDLRVGVHKVVRPIFIAVIDGLVYDKGERWLTQKRDDYGPSNRRIRGSDDGWSYHRWAMAVDLNATTNPSVGSGHPHRTDMPKGVSEFCAHFMCEWGGDWNNPYDPMHIQFVGTRKQAGALVHKIHGRLRKGSYGLAVGVLQRSLTMYGYRLVDDSGFGPRTEAALNAFKKAHRLPQDGVCDTRVWAAMGFNQ